MISVWNNFFFGSIRIPPYFPLLVVACNTLKDISKLMQLLELDKQAEAIRVWAATSPAWVASPQIHLGPPEGWA